MARFSECTALIPLLEALVFLGMGKLLGKNPERERRLSAILLGLGLGLALYAVYLHWLSVIALVTATVLYKIRKSPDLVVLFTGSFFLTAVPFATMALNAGLPDYVGYLTNLVTHQGRVNFSYFQSIFWGLPVHLYTYQPSWGGFLNPILGSICFLGVLETLKNFSNGFYRWLLLSFGFLLLPGILTRDEEAYRVLPILVAVIPFIALGTGRLLKGLAPYRATLVLMALFLPSLGMDFYHLAGPCHRLWDSPDYWMKSVKSINSFRASALLREKALAEGPGVVFQDFNPNNSDQTLSLATYPFDVLADRKRSFEEARWAALLVNVHYRPFLEKRFGVGRAFRLSKDLPSPDGGRMLWVIPITGPNRKMLKRWYEADRALDAFRDASFQDMGYFWGRPSNEILRILKEAYPAFREDPFLRASYWEKIADVLIKSGKINDGEATAALETAVQEGYPAAHLYQRLGYLWLIRQDPIQARKSFQQAVLAPLDLTTSRGSLNEIKGNPTR
jgi:hypothetical protein